MLSQHTSVKRNSAPQSQIDELDLFEEQIKNINDTTFNDKVRKYSLEDNPTLSENERKKITNFYFLQKKRPSENSKDFKKNCIIEYSHQQLGKEKNVYKEKLLLSLKKFDSPIKL